MRTKFALFFLVVCLFGCSSDVRECASCSLTDGDPISFKLSKDKDTIYLNYISKNGYDPDENFLKKDHSKTIDSLKLNGYKIDTFKYDPYNYFQGYYFRNDIDGNIERFKSAFSNSTCFKYSVNCKESMGSSPCSK